MNMGDKLILKFAKKNKNNIQTHPIRRSSLKAHEKH